MGRNNLEKRGKEHLWGYNVTKKKLFKCELLKEEECRLLEVANNLQFKEVSIGISIEGQTDIEINDKVKFKGKTKIVVALSPSKNNPMQGRYKGSLDDFTGKLDIGLK